LHIFGFLLGCFCGITFFSVCRFLVQGDRVFFKNIVGLAPNLLGFLNGRGCPRVCPCLLFELAFLGIFPTFLFSDCMPFPPFWAAILFFVTFFCTLQFGNS